MLVETHSHSKEFSPDSNRSLAVLLDEALRKGFSSLCLTDHFDKDYCSKGTVDQEKTDLYAPIKPGEWIFDPAEYRAAIEKARYTLPQSFSLLTGIEVGYRRDLASQFNDFLSPHNFDQIIGSIHALKDVDLSITDRQPLYCLSKQEAYDYVLDAHIELVKSPFDFDILAHVDYMSRYVPFEDKTMRYEEHPERIDVLFKEMIRRDIALEINNRTRYKFFDQTGSDPGILDDAMLVRYRELGGRLITLASDAHEVGSLGRFFSETGSHLKSLGFKEAFFYRNRQAIGYAL